MRSLRIPDYFAAAGRSLWSIRDCSALRNESSVSIVFVNPAWRSLMVLTKARVHVEKFFARSLGSLIRVRKGKLGRFMKATAER